MKPVIPRNFRLCRPTYSVSYQKDQPLYLYIEFENSLKLRLFICSGCDCNEQVDGLIRMEGLSMKEEDGHTEVTFMGKSTLWDKVEWIFQFREEDILYRTKVCGDGRVDNVRYFEGFRKSDPRMEKFFIPYFQGETRENSFHREVKFFKTSSVSAHKTIYSFSINSSDKRVFQYYEDAHLRINGDRTLNGGDWLATPPPYLYLLGNKEQTSWIGAGLAAQRGRNTFSDFQYFGGETFGFNIEYFGNEKIDGQWESPRIRLWQGSSSDPFSYLENYVEFLRCENHVNEPKLRNQSNCPRWWFEPIFGGWGEQMYLSGHWKNYGRKDRKSSASSGADICTRSRYEEMLQTLEGKNIHPTILIVDNRWYRKDSMLKVDEKAWPDMRKFVDKQHAKGRKVILWVSPFADSPSFFGQDMPKEWMIHWKRGVNDFSLEIDTDIFYKEFGLEWRKRRVWKERGDLPEDHYLPDPHNQEYNRSLRDRVHYLLSPDGLNADGFEFDYTHYAWFWEPRNIQPGNAGRLLDWGMEYLYNLLSIYHDAAKAAKPDSLLISHCFNPYFDDIIDMLRLQDIYTDHGEINDQMEHRAKIGKAVCPGVAIHTDQHPMPSLHAWRTYMPFQPEIGNPCLYYVTGIETTLEKLVECDYRMLSKVWGAYHKKLDTLLSQDRDEIASPKLNGFPSTD